MLSLLHIENIAVIECADIIFNDGFNVLTGETGAGKSIVIDSIGAILGERVSRDMVRTGASMASVRAVFSDVPQLKWFENNGVEYDPEIILQRDIYMDGRNICRVNGFPVTVTQLKRLGAQLINIHGQHDSATLADTETHLTYLDNYADNYALREEYLNCYFEVENLRRRIKRLTLEEDEKLEQMEALTREIEEITSANIHVGEDDELEERRKVLQNAERISDAVELLAKCLYGGDDGEGAYNMLARADKELSKLAKVTDVYEPLHERITDLMYQVQDVADEVRSIRSDLNYSDDELEELECRLDVIYRLRRKYGATCAGVLAYLKDAKIDLNRIRFADDYLLEMKTKLEAETNRANDLSQKLRQNRQTAAEKLTKKIRTELSQLDMPKARFKVAFEEVALNPNGIDSVAFYMSANTGEDLKPLSRVASGGEMARIMLAMKNVVAEKDPVNTLIFDEVDTGVSGRAAQKVAEKLRSVAKNKQVLCVTHLPQLAALASTHFRIYKEERKGRTYTNVEPLDIEGRKMELARIIGGANITEITLQSAEEMLKA